MSTIKVIQQHSKKKKEAHLSEQVTLPEEESALQKIDSPNPNTNSDECFIADVGNTTEKGPSNTSPSSSNYFSKEENLSPRVLQELGANKADDDKKLRKKLFFFRQYFCW